MLIVITLTGILAVVLSMMLSGPMRAYVDTGRRAALVDLGETALARMTREIRLALPNSVRVATGPNVVSVEFLRTLGGARYRLAPTAGPLPGCAAASSGDPLEFTCADAVFDVVGQLPRIADIKTGGDCINAPNTADCVVIFNTGVPGANDAYAGDNIATISALGDDIGFDGSDQITVVNARLTGGLPAFPLSSPSQRFHIVDTPVSFVCNTSTGEITRFEGYPIVAVQPIAPGGASALLINNVGGCSFSYNPGTATRGGLATLSLTVTDPSGSESITLLQQAHVTNQP